MLASPQASIKSTTVFTVIGYLDGCKAIDTITIHVIDLGDAIYVPNTFTPNGDGQNDLFGAVHYGNIDSYSMSIYNRWGQLVFESNTINDWWDGSYKNQIQQGGLYVYYVRVEMNNHPVLKTGQVQLMR